MMSATDIIISEGAVLEEDLAPTKKRQREELVAPPGFDPSCVFLLSMNFENLFDETATNPFVFECRGCGDKVKRTDREKHHRAHTRALNRRETRVPKNAGQQEQRAQRERQADERAAGQDSTSGLLTPKVEIAEAPKKARARTASIKPLAPGTRADSERVLDGLYERLRGVLPAVERFDNVSAGYAAFKLSGRLIGYGWLTTRADLRVEAAIPLGTITDERIVACNRSATMKSRTRIDETTYDLALTMLTAAAQEGQR